MNRTVFHSRSPFVFGGNRFHTVFYAAKSSEVSEFKRISAMYRILVVDDEPSIGKALALGLASNKVKVDVVEDGACGIDLGCREKYDVIIVDLGLPDVGGLEVIKEIKNHSPAVIPIVITANYGKDSCIEALRSGVNDYLEKPLDLQSLRKSIERSLEERQMQRRLLLSQLETEESLSSVWDQENQTNRETGIKSQGSR